MDIVKNNFLDILPKLLLDIKKSTFIAIDTEFTGGIAADESIKRSYFDCGASLYEKESKNFENVSICQIGISTFKSCIDSNRYLVKTYNIFVCPQSILSVDDSILCQASSLEFLKDCNFDFKKWLEEGVPCINPDQEAEVRKYYEHIWADPSAISLPYEVLDELEAVKAWLNEAELNATKDVTFTSDTSTLLFFISLLSSQVKVTPTYQDGTVRLTSSEFDPGRLRVEAWKAMDSILLRLTGFVRVFDGIADAKVPIALHNGIIDVILVYKQFHGRLPRSYSAFKDDLHKMFPVVYDTKQLAFILGVKLNAFVEPDQIPDSFLRNTSLPKVKESLERHTIVLHHPRLEHSPDTPKYSEGKAFPHEAGYDAFCTGFCFLRLSHTYAMLQLGKVEYQRPLGPRELVSAMRQWVNEIPVQKAGVKYVVLGDGDPNVNSASWLVVEPRNPFRTLTPEVVKSFLAPIGTLSVVRRNKRSVIVASPKSSITDDILRTLRDDQFLRVSRYRYIRHSVAVRTLAWSCAVLSTGLSTWLLLKSWKQLRL